jgi:hypothetical protein
VKFAARHQSAFFKSQHSTSRDEEVATIGIVMNTEIAGSNPGATSHAQIQTLTATTPANQLPHVFVDKININIAIVDEDLRQGVVQQIINIPKIIDSGWSPASWGAYRAAARIHVPTSGNDPAQGPWSKDYVLVQAHPRKAGGGFVRLEWNPARFDTEQTSYIFQQLDDNLDLAPSVIGAGKVTGRQLSVG